MKNNRYIWLVILCFLGYALGVLAVRSYESHHVAIPQFVIALLPTIPMVCMVQLILRRLFALDEMWRKILTESMAFAGLATAFTCLSWGFVRDLGSVVKPEWGFEIFWLFYALRAIWAIRSRS